MKKTYNVRLRDGSEATVQSENVHITAQGNIKFLNGNGRNAVLVAFFNAADVINVLESK